jgi:prepilin-type N-terminal cleavage/methylation domain-containing protein
MIERYREIKRQKAAGEREDGFTLIELLIVIVVLGILAAVVVFALGGVTGSSAKSACSADAKTVETAISAYQAQTGIAPTGGVDTQATAAAATNSLISGYLRSWPTNSTHYYIGIGMTASTAPAASSEVDVAPGNTTGTPPAQGAAGWVNFDTEGSAAGCNAVS